MIRVKKLIVVSGLLLISGCGRESGSGYQLSQTHQAVSCSPELFGTPGRCSGSWRYTEKEYTTCPAGRLSKRYDPCDYVQEATYYDQKLSGYTLVNGQRQFFWNSDADCRNAFESTVINELKAGVISINEQSRFVLVRGSDPTDDTAPANLCVFDLKYTYCEACLGKKSIRYSDPNWTKEQVQNLPKNRTFDTRENIQCVSCDDRIPAKENAKDVFDCIDRSLSTLMIPYEWNACINGADGRVVSGECLSATTNPKKATVPSTQDRYRRLKTLYELFPNDLSNDQSSKALGLYERYPSVVPACGEAPSLPAECAKKPGYSKYVFCKRMTSDHAQELPLDEYYSYCVDWVYRLPEGASTAAGGCDASSLLDEALSIHQKLLSRLLQTSMAKDSTEPTDYTTFLKRLDIWYNALDTAIKGMGSLTGEQQESFSKRIFSELSTNLDMLYRQWQKTKTDLAAIAKAYDLASISDPLTNEKDVESIQSKFASAGFSRDTAILKVVFGTTEANGASGADWCKGGCPWQNDATLSGVPLLVVTSNALRQLSERADLIAMFHDHACLFLDCAGSVRPVTPVSKAFALLGSLLDVVDQQKVTKIFGNSCSGDNTEGFCDAAVAIAASNGRLAKAFPQDWLALTDQPVPTFARQLSSVINAAKVYTRNYEKTGFFFGTNTRGFQIGMSEKLQDNVRTLIEQRLGDLDAAKKAYESSRSQGIADLLKLQEDKILVSSLDKAIEQKTVEYNFLKQNIEEHKARANEYLKDNANIVAAFADIKSTIGESALFEIKKDYEALNFTLSADDARYTPDDYRQKHILDPELWAAWSAHEISGLKKGEIIAVATQGTWRPTCALSLPIRMDQATHYCGSCKPAPESWLGVPRDTDHVPVKIDLDLTKAETTTRGYYGVWQGGALKARSWTDAQSTSTGFGFSALGIGANFGSSRQDGPANSKQFESRSAVSLESGIFLPQTPFSGHPAGSLIVVEATGKKLLRVLDGGSPANSFMIEGDPENPDAPISLHFIVNDLRWEQGNIGCDFDKTKAVKVTVSVSEKKGDAAEAVVQAMQETIDELKKKTATDVFSANLASSASLFVEDAMHRLQTKLASLNMSMADFPELENLFRRFVLAEQLQAERKAKIMELQHAMSIVELEIEARKIEKEQQEDKIQTLSSLMPSLRVNNYAGLELRAKAYQLMARVRDFLYPYLVLKYPSLLREMSSVQTSTKIPVGQLLTELQQARPSANIYDLLSKFELTAQALSENLPWAQLLQKHALKNNPVLLGFVKPGKTSTTEWPKASEELSRRVWDAFNKGTSVDIMIDPSDIIFPGGAGTLQCEEMLPIVTEMGFVALSPQATNVTPDNFSGTFSNQQFFAIANGLVEFELQNQGYEGFSTSMYYGETVDAYKGAEYVGLSPFSQFRITPRRLVGGQPATFETKLKNLAVSELVLVMQIEYQRDGGRYSTAFVPACGL